MDAHVTALEVAVARVEVRLDSIDATLLRIDGRLDRLETRFSSEMLTKWDVFQVIVYVLGAATAALLLGPRLLALLPPI